MTPLDGLMVAAGGLDRSRAYRLGMQWLEDLGDALSDPSWTAGMLQALVGALLALAAALWALRLQLAHDRRLAKTERLAHAAAAYGRALLDAYEVVEEMSPRDIGNHLYNAALADKKDPKSAALGADEMYEAVRRAEPALGEHHVVLDLWRERTHLWEQWRQAVQTARLVRSPRDFSILGESVRHFLHPNNEALRRIGTALIRWDGEGDLPGADLPLAGFVPVPLPQRNNKHAYDEWAVRSRSLLEADFSARRERRRASG